MAVGYPSKERACSLTAVCGTEGNIQMLNIYTWGLIQLLAIGETGVKSSMEECADCHPDIYTSYMRHGMANSVGHVRTPPKGTARNPRSQWQYALASSNQTTFLQATHPEGWVRIQRLLGRIGAGILDTSWATVEVNINSNTPVNRWFFAPVESVRGHGLELSPFEHSPHPAGVDMPLTQNCLNCHTDTPISQLPDASRNGEYIYPAHALGLQAFDHLQPLQCDSCHGSTQAHLLYMSGEDNTKDSLTKLSTLSSQAQLDICARCHLQGDVRFELEAVKPPFKTPLSSHIPVLVAKKTSDEYRFVSQVERLSLAKCFTQTSTMTCTTCHSPHRSVKDQGRPSFEKACLKCHSDSAGSKTCSRPAPSPNKASHSTSTGCIDCHMQRSQPFDLPGIRSVDHRITRQVPAPKKIPFRAVTHPSGELQVWKDSRLAASLSTEGGQKWQTGLLAMGYMQTGQSQRALKLFAQFPPPGSPTATVGSAPSPLRALETWSTFHQLRALALLQAKNLRLARAAFDDAVKVEPNNPSALMGRARAALATQDLRQVMMDTEVVIQAFPQAENPWRLRAQLAEQLQRSDFQIKGLQALLERWPSDFAAWEYLAQLLRKEGQLEAAHLATQRAQQLKPITQ